MISVPATIDLQVFRKAIRDEINSLLADGVTVAKIDYRPKYMLVHFSVPYLRFVPPTNRGPETDKACKQGWEALKNLKAALGINEVLGYRYRIEDHGSWSVRVYYPEVTVEDAFNDPRHRSAEALAFEAEQQLKKGNSLNASTSFFEAASLWWDLAMDANIKWPPKTRDIFLTSAHSCLVRSCKIYTPTI